MYKHIYVFLFITTVNVTEDILRPTRNRPCLFLFSEILAFLCVSIILPIHAASIEFNNRYYSTKSKIQQNSQQQTH